ncbi:MAG: class I SAM-dependent methyltransferase [Gammaproteobacteria bacterium]
MAVRTIQLNDSLYKYMGEINASEPEVMAKLRVTTATLPMARMQIAPEQAQFMSLLVQLQGAEKLLEIGTFTGYSALAMALALPENGHLIACDTSVEWTDIAQKYWHEAGVHHKIELRLGPAVDTLKVLLNEGYGERFDFIFIDADKANYPHYYELSLQLLRSGGLIAIDNVFLQGQVTDQGASGQRVIAIRNLNLQIKQDNRINYSVVPIGDGLTLVRKK